MAITNGFGGLMERWHLNGFNLCEVIVIRDGPDALGRSYIDGRHQISIGKFSTSEEARRAVEDHNAAMEHDSP